MAGATFSSRDLVAQESASAAPTSASAPAKAEAAKEESESTDVYRHTALVQSIARALHLDVETTARGFEFINFAIIALAIGIPLFRIVPRIIRKRSETVQKDIESARRVTQDANSRLSAVEAKLAKLDEEIAKFRAEVEAESGQDEARIKATLDEEKTRIVSAAEQEIATVAAQARRGLRHFAADLAIEQATGRLVLTPEADRALIAQFSSDVARGGKN